MCSINGIIYFSKANKTQLNNKLNIMLKLTKHRGPDFTDKIVSDNFALGVNRLSIIAPKDNQVIQKNNQLYALFNGEIVNYRDVEKELKKNDLGKMSDTHVILPAFEKYGQEYIKKLAGMFAIAIYDDKKKRLQLWRDPIGIKPLYYLLTKEYVVFSSELKAIYAVLDKKPKIDFSALDHILRIRFHPGNATVFPPIKRVLPGQTVVFENNETSSQIYWDAKNYLPKKSTKMSLVKQNEITEEFRNLFIKVLDEYNHIDVNGGYFVSGGIDSSLVTSLSLKNKSSFQSPISLKFIPEVLDEKYGHILEKYLNKKFSWVTITSKLARETLEKLVNYIDEPLENPIHVGTYLMAKKAKELGLKTIMTGDGADEFFLGYERHQCWFNKNTKSPTDIWLDWLWTLSPEEIKDLYTEDAFKKIKSSIIFHDNNINKINQFSEAILFEQKERLPEYHCMRLDKMTMAHGIEARVPFLDHRIVEFVQKLPFSFRYGKNAKDWLKKIAIPYLPKEIIQRPKTHFPSLPNLWLQNEGFNWAKNILLDANAKTRVYFKQKTIKRYLEEHNNGKKLRGRLLWALISLELWLNNSWL